MLSQARGKQKYSRGTVCLPNGAMTMKDNRKLSRLSLMAVALILLPASIGFGSPQGQNPKASAQPESPQPDYKDSCLLARWSAGTAYIDACYRVLTNAYACAIVEGGEVEKKAKDNLEQFYKRTHNGTTVGIEKVYNKAKELGCKKESLIPNP
jgi:hypothetical protein